MQYNNDLKGLREQSERLTLLMRDYEDKYQKLSEMRMALGSDNVDVQLNLLATKYAQLATQVCDQAEAHIAGLKSTYSSPAD